MKRITFIATNEYVPWGGSEYCWAAAAERLADQGVDVRASVKNWGSSVKQVERLKSRGCRISYRFSPPPLGERVKTRLVGEGYEKRHLRKVGAGADLIVISQGGIHDGLSWMEAARDAGFRYAVISESANEQWWLGGDGGERLADCMEAAAAAYFVSEANLELLRMQLASPIKCGRVIRNPFNVRYDAKPPWPDDPVDELRLACVARLDSAQKGQDLLIRMLDQPKWRARKVRVVLAGGGVHEKVLHRTVEGLKLPSVEFAGFVEDIEKFWSGHHALILPSRFEGMPLALVEAMLCGRAAIVTDVGGNCELVRDEENGFVAKAPTVEFLDEAMERAWKSRGRLREMGETAARDVRAWVGPDPTGDFVRELEALVDGAEREEKRDPSLRSG